jgi:hypothetical protein
MPPWLVLSRRAAVVLSPSTTAALSILLSVAVLLALAAPSASAHTTIIEPPGSHFPYQQWVDEAKMPTPDVTITVIETGASHGCPTRTLDYAACTTPSEGIIWLSPEAAARAFPREILWHEVGHNVDSDLLPGWARERFQAMLGLSGPWSVAGEPEPYSPSEEFADVFAECALKPYVSPGFVLGLGAIFESDPIGGARLHNRLCQMIALAEMQSSPTQP